MPLVYLVRHPCATVHSERRGQESGLLGVGRQQVVAAYLRDHGPTLWERYGDRIDTMGPHQKEALLWRANVEICYGAIQRSPNAKLVFYENLCRDPLKVTTEVLRIFGLEMDAQVLGFIEASTRPRAYSRLRSGEVGINSFFSVFRDPQVSMTSWKSELGAQEQRDILELVGDSEIFTHGARAAQWSD